MRNYAVFLNKLIPMSYKCFMFDIITRTSYTVWQSCCGFGTHSETYFTTLEPIEPIKLEENLKKSAFSERINS